MLSVNGTLFDRRSSKAPINVYSLQCVFNQVMGLVLVSLANKKYDIKFLFHIYIIVRMWKTYMFAIDNVIVPRKLWW